MLLATLRPYTARWHALQDSEARFPGPTQRLQLRTELQQLQPKLIRLAELLKEMAAHGTCGDVPAAPTPARPSLGADVPMGIELRYAYETTNTGTGAGAPMPARQAFDLMNAAELQHVAARAGVALAPAIALLNRSGLALSGGGIRSATFGLGVVQTLAEAKLLTQFDYLSTVSGGGYLGCFLSNQFTAADVGAEASPAAASEAFSAVFTATPEDSQPVRHLRNCSKYLLPSGTLERVKLVGLLISGVLATTLLAAAMAISGAAASTNMGFRTLQQYRMLMAIFNVRLGYWMRWRQGQRAWLASNAFVQLTREMLGLLNEEASSIDVSDGGHIENLGAYELIRRKLKFIVCIDGGMDGTMDCADLNHLQRLVAIDFGYRLDFDATDLKLQTISAAAMACW